jgi:hypothetical protein
VTLLGFMRRVRHENGHWMWVGSRSGSGYGHVLENGRKLMAHRWGYERLVGPVPAGLEIDHLCRVKACVNPDHLEPVPHAVNIQRGTGPLAENAAKTHCIHGHPLAGANLYQRIDARGGRECRTCRRAAMERFEAKRSLIGGSTTP